MSNQNMARRATMDFVFDGVNITDSMRPYLLSAIYTDNEENETDDLQIKLQDREGIWLTKWLNDAVFYEIYPTSFYDSNGDGIGDLNGIAEKAEVQIVIVTEFVSAERINSIGRDTEIADAPRAR